MLKNNYARIFLLKKIADDKLALISRSFSRSANLWPIKWLWRGGGIFSFTYVWNGDFVCLLGCETMYKVSIYQSITLIHACLILFNTCWMNENGH